MDFADKRVKFKSAKIDLNLGKDNLLEVDLGEVKSLEANQIHFDELK